MRGKKILPTMWSRQQQCYITALECYLPKRLLHDPSLFRPQISLPSSESIRNHTVDKTLKYTSSYSKEDIRLEVKSGPCQRRAKSISELNIFPA